MLGTIGGAIYGGAIAILIPHSGEVAIIGIAGAGGLRRWLLLRPSNPSLNAATVTAVIVLLRCPR